MDLAALVAAIGDGASIAFGGGGLQRKPMAAAKAIGASALKDLEVISMLGGPEVDLLIGLGKVRLLRFAFVGFDAYGLAPNFRKARETGTLPIVEYSEATTLLAFEAGARRLPFQPTRCGLGTDLMTVSTSPFKTMVCPFTGETLLLVPALVPDVAIIHVNIADRAGNGVILGDAYADPLIARAAKRTYLTADRVVEELPRGGMDRRAMLISRLWVKGVCETANGAGFTALYPDHPTNLPAVQAYQAQATDRAWLDAFTQGAAS